jgi:hypothetical protein
MLVRQRQDPMMRFRVNLARLTGTATTQGAGRFVWFSSLLLSLHEEALKEAA